MIRVMVLYPQAEGARFDHDYYEGRHMPFLREKLEPLGMIRAEVDRGLPSGPDQPASFVAVAHLIFETPEQFQKALESVGDEIMADIPNYTDIQFQLQVSEMVE